mmetsp:Transcript_36033/g.78685  ORF Transcript_36033/g.78685 Transcript_36033/m.78685 type:complete len:230 (-) Transcript_36033:897-1586(-)
MSCCNLFFLFALSFAFAALSLSACSFFRASASSSFHTALPVGLSSSRTPNWTMVTSRTESHRVSTSVFFLAMASVRTASRKSVNASRYGATACSPLDAAADVNPMSSIPSITPKILSTLQTYWATRCNIRACGALVSFRYLLVSVIRSDNTLMTSGVSTLSQRRSCTSSCVFSRVFCNADSAGVHRCLFLVQSWRRIALTSPKKLLNFDSMLFAASMVWSEKSMALSHL